jgi:hypothetical protein
LSQSFDEVHVFNGIGERTGVRVERSAVRGRRAVCRSVSELASKARRLGDGYYYLAAFSWPADTETIDMNLSWATMS